MTRRGWLFFCAMGVIWGLPYFLIRIAVRQLDPGVVVLGRTAPAALVLAPLVVKQGQLATLRRHFGWICAFGFLEFGVPWYVMSNAEEHLTSSLTSLLICCVPLLAVIVHRFRRGEERVTLRRYLGLAIGTLGAASLVGLDLGHGNLKWIALMGIVCVGYTFGPIVLATKLKDVPGPTVVMGATAVVSIAWIPWAITHWPRHVSAETVECLATLSLICTVAAFLVFFELVKEAGASRSLVVIYVNTAIAVALGVIGLHEPLTAGIVAGFPLVVVGSFVATTAGRASPQLVAQGS